MQQITTREYRVESNYSPSTWLSLSVLNNNQIAKERDAIKSKRLGILFNARVCVCVLPGEWLWSSFSRCKASQHTHVLPPASHSVQINNTQQRQNSFLIQSYSKIVIKALSGCLNSLYLYLFNMCMLLMEFFQRHLTTQSIPNISAESHVLR